MAEIERPKPIALVFDSRLENLPLVGMSVKSMCDSILLNAMDAYHVELCAVEAVTNVIKHAYRLDPGYKVEMTASIEDDAIILRISDTGEPLDSDYTTHTFSFDPDKPDTAPELGMGVFLINKLMDEVLYKRIAEKNVLTLKKYLAIPEIDKKDADSGE